MIKDAPMVTISWVYERHPRIPTDVATCIATDGVHAEKWHSSWLGVSDTDRVKVPEDLTTMVRRLQNPRITVSATHTAGLVVFCPACGHEDHMGFWVDQSIEALEEFRQSHINERHRPHD